MPGGAATSEQSKGGLGRGPGAGHAVATASITVFWGSLDCFLKMLQDEAAQRVDG